MTREKNHDSGKTEFSDNYERNLSAWMKSNLLLFYREDLSPEKYVGELIKKFNPPLNLSKNKNIENTEYRKILSELRI